MLKCRHRLDRTEFRVTRDQPPSGRSVVDGAFRVLQALPQAGREHQVANLARLTNLPRPTVHRLLHQLRDAGAVEPHDGRWMLSATLLGLTRQIEPITGLRQSTTSIIQQLRDQTGTTVALVVPTERIYVALEVIPGRDALPVDARSGAEMPATTAAGIILGATDVPSCRRRHFGAVVDDQNTMPGVACYAVPVALPGGTKASLQIAAPSTQSTERWAAAVHRAATALSRRAATLHP
ncbi:helix-turn-helix domain-containing protein [Streptomyces hygroscopicus]|uniref:helix-turn-helix domain-containing protein n=1 Tax=Streptomyces hygroscopicus TaxID=1912 RepID=UPI00099F3626|nr:helix-turn-helix domain-containing protein [Streptomyces hygroscopicus]